MTTLRWMTRRVLSPLLVAGFGLLTTTGCPVPKQMGDEGDCGDGGESTDEGDSDPSGGPCDPNDPMCVDNVCDPMNPQDPD